MPTDRAPAISLHLAVSLCMALILAGCDSPPVAERHFQAFGTTVHLIVADVDKLQAKTVLDEIERDFAGISLDWYAFGDGELARINARLAQEQPAAVSEALAAAFRRAQALSQASKGLFDPGVCALVKLWQFDTEEDLSAAKGPPPAGRLARLRAQQASIADLRIEGGTVSADKPLCVDLGGMAKGSALMRALEILKRHGIASAFIDIGGSSQLAVGHHFANRRDPASRSWQIGLRNPRANRLLARLRLASGEAASTSGDYERAYVENGHRYHHILDPRSGLPTDGAASVTVLAEDAELADAASTALMVAGPDRFQELCAALSIRDALLVTTDGQWLATPTMAKRLRRDNAGRTIPLPIDRPQEPARPAAARAKL